MYVDNGLKISGTIIKNIKKLHKNMEKERNIFIKQISGT
jgi:hypothetical protein